MVWLHRWLNETALETTLGENVDILAVGRHNHSSGPDFLESRIKIGSTEWAGSVEIHWRSSDWYSHNHQLDPAYENVILHVVYEHDREVIRSDGNAIPTLVLKGRIQKRLHQRYEHLYAGVERLPCASFIQQVPKLTIHAWLDRVLTERWEAKAKSIAEQQYKNSADWLEGFYQLVARYIGTQYNCEPMAELAQRVPLKLLSRYEDPIDRDALLLGTAGFLKQQCIFESSEDYLQQVKERFEFLKIKHGLDNIKQQWMTGRIRPMNHPQRRVAQLSAMSKHILDSYRVLLNAELPRWHALKLDLNEFWHKHYSINTSSKRRLSVHLSTSLSTIININAAAPFLFYYAQQTGNLDLQQKAIDTLHVLESEENNVVRYFKSHGFDSQCAAHSQAMIQLKEQYCNHKKCVLCNIGRTIIANA